MKIKVQTSKAPQALGPYSQAVLHANIVYCSGQIGINPSTGVLVGDDIVSQTHQVLENLRNILEEAGSSFDNILRTEVFLTNLDDFEAFNLVYEKYFTSDIKPARFTVEVSKLPKNAKIEIACIAYKN